MKDKGVLLVRWCLLGGAVVLTAAGLLGQEQVEVMEKAVKICLECMGIG